MNKGFMQTFAIILLVLSSLILLSIRFEVFMMSGPTGAGLITEPSALRYSVRPESITIRAGSENSTKLVDKTGLYYMEISKALEASLNQGKGLKEITQSEYRAIKDSKSIIISFEPAIDQRLLYGSLFWRDGMIGEMNNIREIILPQSYNTSVYFGAENDRYYAVETGIPGTVQNFESWSSAGGLGQSRYYTIGERFPEYTDNDVLISDEVRLSSYVTESLFKGENMGGRLRTIFGSKYDYANRISETDGSVVLNYDYGREIIKITKEGKVFYQNEDALANSRRTSLTEASSVAMSFISALTGDKTNYVIENASDRKIGDSIGYDFEFGIKENGVRLSFKNDKPSIKLTIVNGKVLSMEGLFRKGTIAVDNNLAFGENAVLYLLEQNLDYIRSKEPFETPNELFDKINSVEYAYIYSENYNYISCYKMTIGNTTFFFKISDAKVVI